MHRTASQISELLICNQLALIKDELLCHWHSDFSCASLLAVQAPLSLDAGIADTMPVVKKINRNEWYEVNVMELTTMSLNYCHSHVIITHAGHKHIFLKKHLASINDDNEFIFLIYYLFTFEAEIASTMSTKFRIRKKHVICLYSQNTLSLGIVTTKYVMARLPMFTIVLTYRYVCQNVHDILYLNNSFNMGAVFRRQNLTSIELHKLQGLQSHNIGI